jgi:hypothetical protein
VAARGSVRIIGADELHRALVEMIQRTGDKSLITSRLETDMRHFAHIITGYMKSTIYHNRMIAGADAYYAGYEADRGGSHDYAQRAINAFPVDKYHDKIVEPF